MSSLQVILSEKAKLMEEVASQFGEVTDEQVAILNELDLTIPAKIDSWALFLKETIPEQIQSFKNKIEEYREGIKKLEAFKEKKELYLHNLLKGNGLEEINGEEKRIVADVSVRRSVDDTKVNLHKEGSYNCNFDAVSWDNLVHFITQNRNNHNWEWTGKILQELLGDSKYKVNVTDLPEDHPAIVKSIRPTVKILKAKK